MSYFGRTTWQTKDGEVVFVSEMSTSHIKNCIRMLENLAKESNYVFHDYVEEKQLYLNKWEEDKGE